MAHALSVGAPALKTYRKIAAKIGLLRRVESYRQRKRTFSTESHRQLIAHACLNTRTGGLNLLNDQGMIKEVRD